MRTKLHSRLWGILPLAATTLLSGCNLAVLDPKGQIGADEKSLIITATWLMLLVVVPVILMTLAFAWKYRASNTRAKFAPDWAHSTAIEAVVWAVPCIIIVILGTITWTSTHDLDPYKPIASSEKPITIEAVALDWKWLFIYPEQGIATVNQIAFPVGVPVNFKVTSASVMNAFFIPQLGSQIYAMAGMETQLHLIANQAGDYDGLSSNFSGNGFSDMKFTALATTRGEFDNWVESVKHAPTALDTTGYRKLAVPSEKTPVTYFSSVDPTLYAGILHSYMDEAGMDKDMKMGQAAGAAGVAEASKAADKDKAAGPSGMAGMDMKMNQAGGMSMGDGTQMKTPMAMGAQTTTGSGETR